MDASTSTGDASTGTKQLPDFALSRVLRLMPVKRVFALMRVNKLWRQTAQSVIRSKKRLQLGVMMNEAVTFVSRLDTVDCLSDPGLEDRMWTSLLTMDQLTVLICADLFPFCNTSKDGKSQESGLQRLVIQNRQTLDVVIMAGSASFPVARDQRIRHKWPMLRTLHCHTIYSAIIDSCPALESVNAFRVTSLLSLDSIKITRLTQLELGCVSGFPIKGFVDVVTQFRKLERLHLYFSSLTDADHSPINRLFCNTTRLQDVQISIPTDTCMDAAIRQLIIRNSGLQNLVLTSMHLTDVSMNWMARASELTVVDIRSPRAQFSPDSLLKLLRGPSRLLLTEVIIHCQQEMDIHLLLQDLESMDQEVGHSPDLLVLKFDPLSDDESDDGMQSDCSLPA